MDLATRLGRNLARCRKRAKLSQEELADLAALHRTEIGLVERGDRIPRVDTLVKLAGALAVPVEELLEGIAWRPSTDSAGSFALLPAEPDGG
jgi:transcriptional regulator with XRE-family HTH domain